MHLAALAGVRPSLREPERFYDVNVMGTLRLFEACRRAGVGRVVFASSSSVYGADSTPPFRESDPCARPLSPYAASKRAGELMRLERPSPGGHGGDLPALLHRLRPPAATRSGHPQVHRRASPAASPSSCYGDGSSSRDYTFIDDIVDGVVAAIDQQGADRQPALPHLQPGRLADHLAWPIWSSG